MAAKHLLNLKGNQFIQGYSLQRITSVPELALTAFEFLHERTGAKHLHLAREDPNKTFSVQFRTTPYDSSGVAHILEHTVLCGSEKYPVRDPFFKMLSRSMSTFMNAFTASDWTMYPFSTLNKTDFYNLMSVYMDAAFKPNLSNLDFKQEGWRLEHEDINNPDSALSIKGIVFNEMKGVFSSSSNIFSEKVHTELLPSGTYGIVSGGDPKHIPSLTWEQLRNFHSDHYHPSNARFYTYGDLEIEEVLEFINTNYLKDFEKREVDTSVPLEPRWRTSKLQEFTCPPDPMAVDKDRQVTVCVSFLLDDITDVYQTFVLGVVGRLLTEGDNSPLFISLMESGLGSDFAPTHGFDTSTRTSTFHAGLKDVAEEDTGKVSALIDETLKQVAKDGFPQERIDAFLHQIELSLKDEGSNFGLGIILSLSYPLNHNADAADLLKTNAMVERLKEDLHRDPQFLQKYVKEYFVENTHKLTSIMRPDSSYEESLEKEYANILENKRQDVDERRNQEIHAEGLRLNAAQSKKDDLSCLPCLKLSDISREGVRESYTMHTVSQVPVQMNEWPTNGVTYFRAMFDLSRLPNRLVPYIPLFGSILPKLGTRDMSYRDMSQAIELHTGGLDGYASVCPDLDDPHYTDPRTGMVFSTHCLDRNFNEALSLWKRLFLEPDWSTKDRLRILMQMEAANLSSAIVSEGHRYAMGYASAGLSKALSLAECWDGIDHLKRTQEIAKQIESEEGIDRLINTFRDISEAVLNTANLRVSVNTTPENADSSLRSLESFFSALPRHVSQSGNLFDGFHQQQVKCTHILMPFSVNYMGQAHRIGGYQSSEYARCRVLSKLMTWKYLHQEIREKGGAYGGGCRAKPGRFVFYSYRDPNSTKTLDAFTSSLDWIKNNTITEQDLMEAKLSVFQEIDSPIPAGSKGSSEFLSGVTDEMRRKHREAVLSVNVQGVKDTADQLRNSDAVHVGKTGIGPVNSDFEQNKDWTTLKIE